ncbi:MAG: SDR family oxidoreductase [Alphaproteobacteria bacterium]|jgi:NAD(P)-dependent dehydrogenase (short-subunit alcohol dehydrogenase family)|nr:SDR family oxidoreductase [Alphaproteobacteria bacterium]MDP6517904.1 SDR family oxidoreductase [Alphaproteobacteria bacterium]
MARLEGKVAMITGGAGGIGRAAGKLFAAEGAKVLLVDLDQAALDAAAQEALEVGGDGVSTTVADVSQPDQVEGTVDLALERYGGLDIALLNAGIEGRVLPITDYPIDLFDQVIAVNVRGVWLGLKYAMPAIARRGGGSIVITSSIAGVRGRPGLSAYVSSKHAVVGMMRTAALEGAANGIRVNTVNPSPIETRMMRSLEKGNNPDDPEAVRAEFAAGSPFGRYGDPEEVAKLMLFLASDDSSYITGSVHMIDSGRHAR